MSQPPRRPNSWAWLLVLLLLATSQLGCLRRRMTIRSNPPGARVYVDDFDIGTTPASSAFTYYGTREISVSKSGYETVTLVHRFNPPWYQFPPLDFITEFLIPWQIRDERKIDVQLIPQVVVPTEQLLGRGEQLRAQAAPASHASPVPALQPVGPVEAVPRPAQPIPVPQPLPAPQIVPPQGAAPGLPANPVGPIVPLSARSVQPRSVQPGLGHSGSGHSGAQFPNSGFAGPGVNTPSPAPPSPGPATAYPQSR